MSKCIFNPHILNVIINQCRKYYVSVHKIIITHNFKEIFRILNTLCVYYMSVYYYILLYNKMKLTIVCIEKYIINFFYFYGR